MLRAIEQREYIQSFIDFVGSFLITESATIDEVNVVFDNLEILRDRITKARSKTTIGPLEQRSERQL